MEEQRDLFGGRAGEYVIPEYAQHTRCGSCKAPIVWIRTANSKAMPLSLATVEVRDGIRYALTHFADCPEAKQWSGKGKKQ